MALTPAERQAKKRQRDAIKLKTLKTFREFMDEIGLHHTIVASRIVSEISELLDISSNETTALFKECFQIESTGTRLCEDIIKFNKDRALQQQWWRFLKELERHNTENVNRLIDKKLGEMK